MCSVILSVLVYEDEKGVLTCGHPADRNTGPRYVSYLAVAV